MASVFNKIFGGGNPSAAEPVKAGDAARSPRIAIIGAHRGYYTLPPYTKWYNVHERYSLADFKPEGFILSAIIFVLVLHLIGARMNRSKAKKWIRAHAAPLTSEFALVGFGGVPPNLADKKGSELTQALAESNAQQGDNLLKEKSLFEFASYATGRANVAFVDVKLTLKKRFNPITVLVETVMGFVTDSAADTQDIVQATLYPFDGKEALLVPGVPGAAELRTKNNKSGFDNFVFAIVHKERMKQVREDRYDLSLTVTKDHSKLPNWLTIMTESAEITDALLTPELIKAAEAAGDLFEYLIVTDQPMDKPKTLDETAPRKRILLKYRMPSNNDYTGLLPIFKYFLRLTDQLTKVAHFRPEVLRKVKASRDNTIKQIQKADEESKAEERAQEREKLKKAKRDQELNALDAKAQKKYLEKEREREVKRSMKKSTTRA
ncbi:hypothetical protein N0V88_001944 [Collariella sp. IMI 366227]|nr:hypothetical protein N0V88_001944 [Collariella sp. IMI 366227]